MSEHPLLFSAEMVRALLDNLKSQTRRIVSKRNSRGAYVWERLVFDDRVFVDPGPSPAGNPGPYLHVPMRPHPADKQDNPELWTVHRVYPRYQVGDRIWVRETWAEWYDEDASEQRGYIYRATCATPATYKPKWRPSIFMPRRASRILLEITEVRAQRVQEISDADAIAEGACPPGTHLVYGETVWNCTPNPAGWFKTLWDSINQKRGFGWVANPYTWALAFKRLPNHFADASK